MRATCCKCFGWSPRAESIGFWARVLCVERLVGLCSSQVLLDIRSHPQVPLNIRHHARTRGPWVDFPRRVHSIRMVVHAWHGVHEDFGALVPRHAAHTFSAWLVLPPKSASTAPAPPPLGRRGLWVHHWFSLVAEQRADCWDRASLKRWPWLGKQRTSTEFCAPRVHAELSPTRSGHAFARTRQPPRSTHPMSPAGSPTAMWLLSISTR